jgi:hypothetical protein
VETKDLREGKVVEAKDQGEEEKQHVIGMGIGNKTKSWH